ncbi:MAG: thiamine pyrophosphate-dependent enzyme [Chloroflexi bacterium]|nr:thiamine pyrophosphate-dependent enzyme [Chloroflexota bacterium]MCL5074327.1 thiamine pyrophosphate-dependent enzyme [Chloroflexota bacterium]
MVKVVFKRPEALTETPTHYCPGCTHGIIHRLVAEVVDELSIRECTIGVAPVGCAVFAYDYFNFDCTEAAHGRAPAVATGIKRVRPDKVVFTYQGDGDLAAIGMAEIVHAAIRGEQITVIFVNNAVYGMTGGQMAPTTLAGQYSTSTPGGRDVKAAGNPVRICELLAQQDGPAYIARVAVNNPPNVAKAKSAIKLGFRAQLAGLGFSLVEVLSSCPVGWRMRPIEALTWLAENMIPHYPLGEYRVSEELTKLRG